jgi:hypothetical protein
VGFFKDMKNMQAQGQDAMAAQPSMMEQAMGGQSMQDQAAYAQLAQKLQQSGVEAPGVVHAIRATGQTDMGGGQMTEFDVSIKPADGDPFQTTVKQSMLPAMLEEVSEGQSITVKYDPDSPTSAMIFGW